MSLNLNPQMKEALAARVRYYREMGIYDLYRRDVGLMASIDEAAGAQIPSTQDSVVKNAFEQDPYEQPSLEEQDDMAARKTVVAPVASDVTLVVTKAEAGVSDPVAALK